MKNKNTFKFLFAATLIGGSFAVSAMEADKKQLGEELCKAARAGNLVKLNNLIQAGADVNQKDEDGWPALLRAAANNRLACVQALLNAKADSNITGGYKEKTALIWAAGFQNLEIVNVLINAKADPNVQDEEGNTALIEANISPEILRMLIAAQANLELKNKRGTTPLISSLLGGNPECVQLLMAAGANIHAQDDKGEDALTIVFPWMNRQCQDKCVNLLIDTGADLRTLVRKYGTWITAPLIERSIEVAKKRKTEACALLWCMKEGNQDNMWDKTFSLLVGKPLFEPYSNHREMLEQMIDSLENEHDKIVFRAALEGQDEDINVESSEETEDSENL